MSPLAHVLGHVFGWVVGSVIFKVLAAFGIGWVVMTGVNALIDGVFAEIQALTAGAPAQVVAVLGMLRIDDAITVLASAVSIRISLKTFGVGGGGIKKLVFGASSNAD